METKLAHIMGNAKDGKLPKFTGFRDTVAMLKADGAAIGNAGRGHYKGVAAYVTALCLTQDIRARDTVATLKGVWADMFGDEQSLKSIRSRISWAVGQAIGKLEGKVTGETSEGDALAMVFEHFRKWDMFGAYNRKNTAAQAERAAAAPKAGQAASEGETVTTGNNAPIRKADTKATETVVLGSNVNVIVAELIRRAKADDADAANILATLTATLAKAGKADEKPAKAKKAA